MVNIVWHPEFSCPWQCCTHSRAVCAAGNVRYPSVAVWDCYCTHHRACAVRVCARTLSSVHIYDAISLSCMRGQNEIITCLGNSGPVRSLPDVVVEVGSSAPVSFSSVLIAFCRAWACSPQGSSPGQNGTPQAAGKAGSSPVLGAPSPAGRAESYRCGPRSRFGA